MKKKIVKKYRLKESVSDFILDILAAFTMLLLIYFLMILNNIIF